MQLIEVKHLAEKKAITPKQLSQSSLSNKMKSSLKYILKN